MKIRDSELNVLGIVRVVVIIICVAIGVWAFHLISTEKKTALESDLLALILTAVSIAASWLTSKFYAEESASKNLRDYGVQIARGVIVLQSEIKLLSSWVARKRTNIVNDTSRESLDAAFDHVQETLTAFRFQTDAALSGIAGVIGDALSQYDSVMEEIRKTREKAAGEADQIEKRLREISGEDVAFSRASRSPEKPIAAVDVVSSAELESKLELLAKQTEERIAALSRKSSLPILEEPADRNFEVSCPACGTLSSGSIKDRGGETKSVKCEFCSSYFNLHTTAGKQLFVRLISVGNGGSRSVAIPTGLAGASPSPAAAGFDAPAMVASIVPLTEQLTEHLKGWPQYVRNVASVRLLSAAVVRIQNEGLANSIRHSQVSLREAMFADQALLAASISRRTIRDFVTALFFGRLVLYDPGAAPAPQAQWENTFTEDQVLCAYVRAAAGFVGRTMNSLDTSPVALVDAVLDRSLVDDALLLRLVEAANLGLALGTRKREEGVDNYPDTGENQ